MLGLVVEFVGHLVDESGEEIADSFIVLAEKVLPGGGFGLYGTHSGVGGFLNVADNGGFLCCGGSGVVLYIVAVVFLDPTIECAARYAVLACNSRDVAKLSKLGNRHLLRNGVYFGCYTFTH